MTLLILSQQEPPQPQDQVLQVKCIQYYTKMIKAINQIIKHMKEINLFKDRKKYFIARPTKFKKE